MAITRDHELHLRRWSRNLGLGLVLAAFVALVFGLTIVKVTHEADQHIGRVPASQGTGGQP
jgi:hypothetical protein